MSEDLIIRRKRLRYRSWHRGTKELDLLIGAFAERHLEGMGEADLSDFEAILDVDEHQIYAWLSGREAVPAAWNGPVMQRLLDFKFSEYLIDR